LVTIERVKIDAFFHVFVGFRTNAPVSAKIALRRFFVPQSLATSVYAGLAQIVSGLLSFSRPCQQAFKTIAKSKF
jgi:hypothetical protein